ncbi:TPA: hypothetical protein KUM91_001103 [Serratia marcescens]|nr:hypothetical protein [Serratia marcescens]
MKSNEHFEEMLKTLDDYDRRTEVNDKSIDEILARHSKNAREVGTRSGLTYIFLIGFFSLIILSAVFVFIYNSWSVDWAIKLKNNGLPEVANKIMPLELEKVLSVLIGAFGTSLGFIIGYYYKENKSL